MEKPHGWVRAFLREVFAMSRRQRTCFSPDYPVPGGRGGGSGRRVASHPSRRAAQHHAGPVYGLGHVACRPHAETMKSGKPDAVA